jgi:hypothetical protein
VMLSRAFKRKCIAVLVGMVALASFTISAPVSAEDVPIIPPFIPVIPTIPTIPTAPADTVSPTFTGAQTGYNGSDVYLYFDESFTINSGSEDTEAFLKRNISVAVDGVNYVPLQEQSYIDWESNYIYIEYEYDMQVVLGPNTRIKIAANTIKDMANNNNAELTLDVSPPAIQGVTVSSDNHDVTVTFSAYAYNNAGDSLKDRIRLDRNGNSETLPLLEGDTVTVKDGTLIIHFKEALTGTNNLIEIQGNTIKDIHGNTDREYRMTRLIAANPGVIDPNPVDGIAPQFMESYFSNNFTTANFVFSEDVVVDSADLAAFRAAVQYYSSGWKQLTPDDVVTISGNTVAVNIAAFTGFDRYVSIRTGGWLKDLSGNKIGDRTFGTEWLYNPGPTFEADEDSYLSYSGRKLMIEFDIDGDLVDRTLADGVSRLKEKITISQDRGATFSPLAQEDIVEVQWDRVIIYFHANKTSGTVHVKISEGVLSDKYDTRRNSAVDLVAAYNTPELKGYLFSDAPSEFIFADNAEWRSKVKAVYVNDSMLLDSEYALTAGKITFEQGLFQEGMYYDVEILTEGYSSKYFEARAYRTADLFYMTEPTVTKENGITASFSLYNNMAEDFYYYSEYLAATSGTQTVLFQLMNGDTPVSIIAADFRLNSGTYTGNFNVADADTNANYSVRAFVVSKYNNDPASVGLNLATVKSQGEIDLLIMQRDLEGEID